MTEKTFRVLQVFCGLGGKGLGAKDARAVFGDASARFETIGGIDIDAQACRDFEVLVGAPTLCIDIHELEPAQLRAFVGDEAPDAVMMSPPCKGFSGLLSAKRAKEPKYERMNTLMLRALFLLCETWERPPSLIFVENVPRITSRGKKMLRQCRALLEGAGYAIAEGNHDCGELGGLAQHRRRYFLLARQRAAVPQLVYQPRKLRVRACGEVLGPLPMPGDVEAAGPMHSVPRLSWRNWLRLALIPAGGDWRDLPGVLVDGEKRREKFRRAPVTGWAAPAETVTGPGGSAAAAVADPRVALTCEPRSGAYGVLDFDRPSDTVTAAMGVDNARAAVADPRFGHVDRVTSWDGPVGTITRSPAPSSGAGAVADPRRGGGRLGVTPWDAPSSTVTGEAYPSTGPHSVADPRIGVDGAYRGVLGVSGWGEPASTVTGNGRPQGGRFSAADPRFADGKKKNWQRVAGVTAWTEAAPTVTSGAKIHAGAFQVADPRCAAAGLYRILTLAEALALDLPLDKAPPWIPVIIAADGTWHRPLTTLEIAVLQSLPERIDGAPLVLAGTSHTRWREAIGNAVPPAAALAIAEQLLQALLLSSLGAFALSNEEVWVAPMREGLAA